MDGVLAATRVVNGDVPVAAYRVPGLVLGDIDEFIVLNRLDLLCGAVGRVVVYDNDIEGVGCTYLLIQRTMYGVSDRAGAVLTRNDDGSGYRVFFG